MSLRSVPSQPARPKLEPRAVLPGPLLSDQEIVDRVLAGETPLFELLMRRHNQLLYRTLRAILQDDSEAEDAMQDCYVRAFTQLERFEGRSQLSTWLVRIGVNLALDRVRRRGRVFFVAPSTLEQPSAAAAEQAATRTPEDELASREIARLLQTAIDRLPLQYRAVFVLREIEQLDTRQTAECLGIAEGTVKTRLRRSRARLQELLDQRAGASSDDLFRFGGEHCDRIVAAVLARVSGAGAPPA